MIHLTDSALNAVRNAISSAPRPSSGLRIKVQTGGCAGFKYMMGLVNEAEADDTVIEHRRFKRPNYRLRPGKHARYCRQVLRDGLSRDCRAVAMQ